MSEKTQTRIICDRELEKAMRLSIKMGATHEDVSLALAGCLVDLKSDAYRTNQKWGSKP